MPGDETVQASCRREVRPNRSPLVGLKDARLQLTGRKYASVSRCKRLSDMVLHHLHGTKGTLLCNLDRPPPRRSVTTIHFESSADGAVIPALLSPPSINMHHVFEVDEILRLIASSLVYEDRTGAISFACCCKSFSAPTLDTLWGIYYYDFTRLLRTLPPQVWTIRGNAFVRFPPTQSSGHHWLITFPRLAFRSSAIGG